MQIERGTVDFTSVRLTEEARRLTARTAEIRATVRLRRGARAGPGAPV
jgi:hypothetical protein